jgi:4-diphosphocytidyl-2-C-methyl-D-erythritol kinase
MNSVERRMVKLLRELAPAKINLFLRVTGRRPDGYHELDSVFVPISIYDRVDIEVRPARSASVQLSCDSGAIPADARNLAFQAAREFLSQFDVHAEVMIQLHKEIPAGAGLGGGSSDAGAVLRMMAGLCGVARSEPLEMVAARLGADVPFFLNPLPSRVRGIGERCQPLAGMERLLFVIAVPPIEVRTALVFQDLQPKHWSGPAPELDLFVNGRGSIGREQLVNDLEQVAIPKWPQIGQLKQLFEALGARGASMTGSGGAVFGIFDSSDRASRACREVINHMPDVRVFIAGAVM